MSSDEAKQLQYAIKESLKDCKLYLEKDFRQPLQKRFKLSPGEKDDESVELDETNGHPNKDFDDLNRTCYVNDAIEQDSRVYVLRNVSSDEKEMETDTVYDNNVNNNNDG